MGFGPAQQPTSSGGTIEPISSGRGMVSIAGSDASSLWLLGHAGDATARRTLSSSSSGLLTNTTSYLRNLDNGAEIFLVGTAHVSKASAQVGDVCMG